MKNFKNEAKIGNLEGKHFPEAIIVSSLKLDHILGKDFAIVTINAREDEFISSKEIEYWKLKGTKFIGLSEELAKSLSETIDVSKKHMFIIKSDRIIYKHIVK